MQTPNSNKSIRPNNPAWHLLAEYSLSEFLSELNTGDKLKAGLLLQTVRELGLPPEYVENIEMMLIGFAKEALEHFKQGGFELPGRIRIFCQKKMIDDSNPAKTSIPYNTEQMLEQPQIVHRPGKKMYGGWGYFLIERGDDVSTVSSVRSWNSVELYLYREGE
jgi:hypothetical protein